MGGLVYMMALLMPSERLQLTDKRVWSCPTCCRALILTVVGLAGVGRLSKQSAGQIGTRIARRRPSSSARQLVLQAMGSPWFALHCTESYDRWRIGSLCCSLGPQLHHSFSRLSWRRREQRFSFYSALRDL